MIQPLTKPERGSGRDHRRLRSAERRKEAERQAKREALEAAKLWQIQRAQAYHRDSGRCRAFGTPLPLNSPDLLKVAHTHHYVYRSAGGTDDVSNLITLSARAHDMEHRHELRIAGEPDGELVFTLVNLETGAVIRRWESTVLVEARA